MARFAHKLHTTGCEAGTPVDELVELVGAHPHKARLFGLGVAVARLLGQGRVDGGGRGDALLDQHFAEQHARRITGRHRVLGGQCLIEFVARDGAGVDQDVTEVGRAIARRLDQRDDVGDPAVRRDDAHRAALAHQVKGGFDLFLGSAGLQADLEAQVAALRVECIERGNRLGQDPHRQHLAESSQIVDDGERIESVAKRVLAKTQ